MARLHPCLIVFCLFALTCTAHAEIGTVRLMEDRQLFAAPATATGTPDQFVKVICNQDETTSSRTVTNTPIQPLIRASKGETLTILEVIRCADTNNGAYVRARTVQHSVGYTQLPNYHTRIQTTDAEGAYQILFLIVPPCILTQYHDPECRASGYADPFANYIRLYPVSSRAPKAAEFAAVQYKFAADTFQYIADQGWHPNPALTRYATRYTRDTLLAKANEYRKLEQEMQALVSKPHTAPKQSASAPTQQATPAPPSSLGNILTAIFYALLLLLTLAYIIGYGVLYTRISGHFPGEEIRETIIEGSAALAIAAIIPLFFSLSLIIQPFVFIGLALVFFLRLDAGLEPARQQRTTAQLQRKQETLDALLPLLNALHATYGRYSDMPELIPATWYAPHKH
jgi:hypothetical protein